MYMKSRLHLLQPILLFSLFATGCGLFDFSKERDLGPPPLLKAASTELSTTTITPHTYAPLDSLRNQVYCASFALAWNTAIDSTFGEPIVLEGSQETREMVEALNLRLFRNEYLDPDSYLALSGFRKDGILERIAAGLLEKFGEDAPSFDITLQYPESFLSYAYLVKRLDFEHVFESLKKPIEFNGDSSQKVMAFGVGDDVDGNDAARILQQVIVRGYSSRGYIIEIETTSDDDHLILAMVEPGETLQETWERVVDQDEEDLDHPLESRAVFKAPKINFDLTHKYLELIDRRVLNSGWYEDEYYIDDAFQNIRFQLTERGVELKSEGGFTSAPRSIPPEVIFDQPFLLALIEEGAKEPYFLMWIANAELLARVK